MSFTTSKIFLPFLTDALNGTAAFDLNSDTLKCAQFGNSGTPDQSVAAALSAYNTGQWVTGNETANGGWSAGGLPLTSVTSGFAANVYTLDAADLANATAATISPHGCFLYDDTLTTPVADQGISFHYYGGVQPVTAGTLTVVWNPLGIDTFTL